MCVVIRENSDSPRQQMAETAESIKHTLTPPPPMPPPMIDAKVAELMQRENIQQHTPAWFETRGKMLTASDVASAIGANPYCSRSQLLQRKVCMATKTLSRLENMVGTEPPRSLRHTKLKTCVQFVRRLMAAPRSNTATAWGNATEDEAAMRYDEVTGRRGLQFGLFVHPTHTWLGASPDRVTHDGILVEIKCPIKRAINESTPIPSYYMPQVQIQMEVMDIEECDFVQYQPGSDWQREILAIQRIKRDRGWFAEKFDAMKGFFDEWMEIMACDDELLDFVYCEAQSYNARRSELVQFPTKSGVKRKRSSEESCIEIRAAFPFIDV